MRLDVGANMASGSVTILVKGDLLYDAVTRAFAHDLREGYAGVGRGSLDLRVGRQIVTWGLGDLFFINDVFPKDWDSFFSGRPMEYLKLGVDGIRAKWSSNVLNADVLAVPVFTADKLPSSKRFSLGVPFPGVVNQQESKPTANVSNTELALRLHRHVSGFDMSVYAYRGFWRTPSVRIDPTVSPTSMTRFYPGLAVYGASLQKGLGDGVFSAETGYYDSRGHGARHDPAAPNSEWRVLAVYQYQPWRDATVGVQAYAEVRKDNSADRPSVATGPPPDRVRGVFSVRVTQQLRYQIWRPSIFIAYSPTDTDVFVRPELGYKPTENLSLTFGATRFAGATATTFFGQFKKDNNLFLNVRVDF
ncbi:MAG: hypothetical protein HYX76_12320 [Acidobacteria bacterium]|nr:hypothetical protein [Acidobacteriota bacterium]